MATPSALSSSLPRMIKPMLARLSRRPFDSPDHLYELKWDGIRALAFVDGGGLRLLSRTGRDITGAFPELSSLPGQLKAGGVVLDGELVCLDEEGHPSFHVLQRRLRKGSPSRRRKDALHFISFDVLYVDSRSVMKEPLLTRKAVLNGILESSDTAQACDFIQDEGEAFFQATCDLGLEGVVAKEKSSPYLPGRRSQHWLKVKRVREAEFVVGGYTFGGTRRERFSSLLLGLHDSDRQLVYVGQVYAGVPRSMARELHLAMEKIHIPRCPFSSMPQVRRFIFWCRPELVCQVEYGEFTEEGVLAYPVFKALRDDKAPSECVIGDAPGWPMELAELI